MEKVILHRPIKREGGKDITEVLVREPEGGDLRGKGLNLYGLGTGDVGMIQTVLPRITDPSLLPAEVDSLSAADLMQFAQVLTNFLMPSAEADQLRATMRG